MIFKQALWASESVFAISLCADKFIRLGVMIRFGAREFLRRKLEGRIRFGLHLVFSITIL